VGVNCTRPEYIGALLKQMRDHTDKPLLVYPNSGEHYDAGAKRWRGRADATRQGPPSSVAAPARRLTISAPCAQDSRDVFDIDGVASSRGLSDRDGRQPR